MIDLIDVEVLEIQHSGIWVRILEGDRLGFIRRRELSWDRRLEAIPPGLKVGESFRAKILEDREGADCVYLSLRQLTDPWEGVKDKYYPGQVVQGEVVNIRHFGIFVQVEPGIDAIVWPKDIPLLRDQRLVDVISMGDKIVGVITQLNLKDRQLELGLSQRLQELTVMPDSRRSTSQLELFRDRLTSLETEPVTSYTLTLPDNQQIPSPRYFPPIPKPQKLLVIDDNKTDLQNICHYLHEQFEVEVEDIQSGKEALEKFKNGSSYDLAILDLTLADEHGLKVAEEMHNLKPDLNIILTSANPLAGEELANINQQRLFFAVKTPEEIAGLIDKLGAGYLEKRDETAFAGPGNFIQQLGMEALARHSLPEVLQRILTRLRREAEVSQAMILEVDLVNKLVSIVAADPPIEAEIQERSLDGLYYSPVREVVEDEEEFYASEINQDRDRRFRYFFPLLAFKTCFGLPLKIPDLITRHALFILDEHKQEFNPEILNQVRQAAGFIQIALERALLLDYMQRYERRYTLGQLLGSLVHEAATKLDGLNGQIGRLSKLLEQAEISTGTDGQPAQVAKALEITHKIHQARGELSELVEAYSRIVKGDLEAVDVNEVVRKIKRQLETKAREAAGYIKIHLDEQRDLPLARTISSRLEQILLNLVLNAVQQIEKHYLQMKQVTKEKDEAKALFQEGLVIVQTRYNTSEIAYPIQIIVIDNGPGIHRYQQERIFWLDTSTRQKGQGLGLFISRNLAETMGGQLRLVDSFLFMGSAFMVVLPKHSVNGE